MFYRKTLMSIITVLICLTMQCISYAASNGNLEKFIEERDVAVGEIFTYNGDGRNFYYNTDNESVSDLVTIDGKYAVKFTAVGDVTIRCLFPLLDIENKRMVYEAHKFVFHVKDSKAMNNDSTEYLKYAGYSDDTFVGDANGARVEWAGEGYVNSVKYRTLRGTLNFNPVPINQLQNADTLHYNLTEEQYKASYDAALEFSRPAANLPLKEKLKYVAVSLRVFKDKYIEYSTSAPHWIDTYGYFILKKASCQGATNAVGMVLNQLGIPYEHVNFNKWTHQWCRVKVGSEYWICDAYGVYYGPEPAPYQHPVFR